nr:beta-N-acetylglucosaminidase domain-containing protein [Micromonospora pallida]
MRGTVEGFYGPPWTHAERLAHLEFSALVGLDTYVYAPKNDPYHRSRWREAYPAEDLAHLAELVERARVLGIRFVYAISPGLDMRFADHGLVPLGLARASAVLLLHDRVRIVAPDDPLAAGFDGHVPVYRGPGKLTVADVGPQARVVARVADEDRAVLFHYPAGIDLADGTTAPASRIGIFLGADAAAPWLVTPEGHAIVTAAVDVLLAGISGPAVPAPRGTGSEVYEGAVVAAECQK